MCFRYDSKAYLPPPTSSFRFSQRMDEPKSFKASALRLFVHAAIYLCAVHHFLLKCSQIHAAIRPAAVPATSQRPALMLLRPR